MSDFRVHPILRSPTVAAVFFGIVGAGLFDVGIADGLRGAGESAITVNDWIVLNEGRWGVVLISAMLAGFAWYLTFSTKREDIKVPLAGVILGVIGAAGGAFLIWSLFYSIHLPEFEAAAHMTWRFAALWSGLVVLAVIGCIRFGLFSYRMMRGKA